MVPVISSFNHLVRIKVEGPIFEEENSRLELLKRQNKINALEKEKLENQITIAKQTIEIEALSDNIKLLENAQLSVQSFEKILELALLQTNLKQTLVRKEPLQSLQSGWGFLADYYYDEVLVVHTHDIIAKFGVALNEIKVSKQSDDTVIVSGIHPKFIGTSKNITNTPIKEIRTNNYKRGVLVSVDTNYKASGISQANSYAEQFEKEFQTKLSEGLELNFMDDAVIQLAQNFIKVMFAPLYANILFDTVERPGALAIMDYLKGEIKNNNEKKNELLKASDNLSTAVMLLDDKIAEAEY